MSPYDFTNMDPFLHNLQIRKFILNSKYPFFIYDLEKIKKNFISLKNALPRNFQIYYSMKANPNVNVVRFLYTLGCGVEVASGGELETATKVGVPPEKIIFAGPGKRDEELFQAIKCGIKVINVESFNELSRVNEIAKSLNCIQDVNIRVNPLFKIEESALQMGGDAQKFGIDFEQMEKLKMLLTNFKNTNLVGIHVFSATQILNQTLIVKNFENTIKIAQAVSALLMKKLTLVDMGSGLGIPYSKNEHEVELGNLKESMQRIIDSTQLQNNTSFVIETGRFLVGESGYYVTQVIDKKISRGKTFIICDGGINHLLRTALINTAHPIAVIQRNAREEFETVSIGGSLCTSLDFFAKDVVLPLIEIGDYIVVKNSGAYGYTESMPYFLSHDFADEYLYVKDEIKLIRKGRKIEDMLAEQILVL